MSQAKDFIMIDFDKQKPFSSFFPGVAGEKGIPIWAFYANRGQGITSFGVKDKNGAILEFNPACIAYEKVQTNGFRTFIKINNQYFEPFTDVHAPNVKRSLRINSAILSLEEVNLDQNYQINIEYFTLSEAPIGALVRKITIKNLASKMINLEVLDGLTHMLPRGISNGAYKDVGNLMRSWIDVLNYSKGLAFFKIRSSSSDEAEVHLEKSGNFYLAKDDENALLIPIVDASIIFGSDLSKQIPQEFINSSLNHLYQKTQYPFNKVPCAFFGLNKTLMPQESISLYALIGMAHEFEHLELYVPNFLQLNFFEEKRNKAMELITELTKVIDTSTALPNFDEYLKQSYLDNGLRGGFPINLGGATNPKPYYLYSRKHGDPERDYNWFNLEPEYYSQGNGNYRDINQNRRNDILFHQFVGTSNIKNFMNLIQIDGYNPLSINGCTYQLTLNVDIDELINKLTKSKIPALKALLQKAFTPGSLYDLLSKHENELHISIIESMQLIFSQAKEEFNASFGEGYWIDHFTYNFDLIETYLLRYPDQEETLLFSDRTYRYFQSPVEVLPRKSKIGLTSKGDIRQYGSLRHFTDKEKHQIGFLEGKSNYHKTIDKEIYQSNLVEKLISLATVKFATLDPKGYGIMMEANKPGWNDAMNGLPGLLASGIPEAIELLRIVNYLVDVTHKYSDQQVTIYQELKELIDRISNCLIKFNEAKLTEFLFWNERQNALETYRETTKFALSGDTVALNLSELGNTLTQMKEYLVNHLEMLIKQSEIIPTYLVYTPTKYQALAGFTSYGLQQVNIEAFTMRALPAFLEAPARILKVAKLFNKYDLPKRYQTIKQSELFDKQLKLYKTSVDLDNESLEIGRIRAFTKGWLERESNFVHMSFKYLYGLLKSGQYEAFYEDFKTSLPPFMDPYRYGRNIYENVSFIATSNNPDPETHGTGFVARLSGCNAEVVSMWFTMMFGHTPFHLEDGKLILQLKPLVPSSFFKDGIIKTKFLGSIEVIYHYQGDLSTFDERVKVLKYELIKDQMVKEIASSSLIGQDAIDVRNGVYSCIKVTLGQQI